MSEPETHVVNDVFPCGCEGYMERRGNKSRLVVIVNPECPWDAKKVGNVEGHVRYEAKS